MSSNLFKDHNGNWVYKNRFVSQADLISLEVDLDGATGEISRWEQKVRDIQSAISSIVDSEIEPDSPSD